jgi:signal transduction histidine kinase
MSPAATPWREGKLAPAEVLGAVAHELRQPLSSIESIAYYLTLVLPGGDERVQTQLTRIRQLVEQSNWILSNGITLAECGAPAPEPIDLEELITQAVSSPVPARPYLCLALAGNLPQVRLDPRQGRALVHALLILFRPLGAENHPVTLRTSVCEKGVLLELEAPGIRPAFGPGAELALESARKIAQAHGGTLECEADALSGIRVRVMLP